ncbi:MAG: flagellar biosynthesis protein FlhF [Panacagrimonas sp.]
MQTVPDSQNIASSGSAPSSDPPSVRYLLKREAPEPAPRSNSSSAAAQASLARAPLMRPRLEPERPAPLHEPLPDAVEAPSAPAHSTREIDAIRCEMQSLRRAMEQQLGAPAWGELKSRNPVRADVVRSMTAIGLELKLAREIATELPDDATPERARVLPMGLLARRIPAFKQEWLDAGGVVALVGPTGVGKTTTIAKLAARYIQTWGLRDVALVTTDHFRIGAQEQLFTYGRLLGVPVLTADHHKELCQALDKLRDRKLVLIDTAGMSPRDANLEQQFAMLAGLPVPIRTALVMAAGSQGVDIDDQFKRFAPASPGAVILTKCDEARRIGPALSAVIRHGVPIAYVTDGQRVPEDLSTAQPDQLVLRAMQLSRKPPETPDEEDDGEFAYPFAGAAAHG